MSDFQTLMRERLRKVQGAAAFTSIYCSAPAFEGSVLYEMLIDLENTIGAAIDFYVTDAPAANRQDLVSMDNARKEGRV